MSIFSSGGVTLTRPIFQVYGKKSTVLELLIFGGYAVVIILQAIWPPTWLKHQRAAIATVGAGFGKALLARGKDCAAFIVKVRGHFRIS
ncbi:hypothetical protein ES705_38187 [subsurface metagenome]